MTRRPSAYAILPAAVLCAVAVASILAVTGGHDSIQPVAIQAAGPRFVTLDQLATASDRIVTGTVVEVGPGRSIADPSDPEAGIVTQLARFELERTVAGQGTLARTIVIEQEAMLLDGTPITVNGLVPLRAGDRGLAFLLAGASEDFPYLALVNEQAWFELDGDRIASDRVDPVHTVWNGRLLAELLADLAGSS